MKKTFLQMGVVLAILIGLAACVELLVQPAPVTIQEGDVSVSGGNTDNDIVIYPETETSDHDDIDIIINIPQHVASPCPIKPCPLPEPVGFFKALQKRLVYTWDGIVAMVNPDPEFCCEGLSANAIAMNILQETNKRLDDFWTNWAILILTIFAASAILIVGFIRKLANKTFADKAELFDLKNRAGNRVHASFTKFSIYLSLIVAIQKYICDQEHNKDYDREQDDSLILHKNMALEIIDSAIDDATSGKSEISKKKKFEDDSEIRFNYFSLLNHQIYHSLCKILCHSNFSLQGINIHGTEFIDELAVVRAKSPELIEAAFDKKLQKDIQRNQDRKPAYDWLETALLAMFILFPGEKLALNCLPNIPPHEQTSAHLLRMLILDQELPLRGIAPKSRRIETLHDMQSIFGLKHADRALRISEAQIN